MSRLRDSTSLLRRLAGRLRALTPAEALGTVILLALSQGLLLLAFILPLKIVLLVTQPELPAYLDPWVSPEERIPFIAGLAVASVLSYGLHHLCQWGANRAAERGSRRIAASHDKLRVFADAETLMRDSYHRLGRIGASTLLAAGTFTLGLWLDPLVFLVLAGLAVVEALAVMRLATWSSAIGNATRSLVEEKLGFLAGILGSVNFLLAFVVLMVTYLQGAAGNPLIAIVTLLLARESQQKLVMLLQDAHFLDRREQRIRPLYFSADLAPGPGARMPDNTLTRDFTPSARTDWLQAVLDDIHGAGNSRLRTHYWVDSAMPGVLWLCTEIDGERGTETLGVKWFEQRALVMADHEAELLANHPARDHGLLGWIGQARVAGHRVFLLPWPGEKLPDQHNWRAQRLARMVALWGLQPDKRLAQRYRRTHRLVWERLPAERLEELGPVLECEEDREKVSRLTEAWDSLLRWVKHQPLALHNPAMAMRGNWRDDETPVCLRWDQWVIEPVGHEPALVEYRPEELRHALEQVPWPVDTHRPDPTVVYLAGLLCAFEKALNQRHLSRAKEVAFRMLDLLTTMLASDPGPGHQQSDVSANPAIATHGDSVASTQQADAQKRDYS